MRYLILAATLLVPTLAMAQAGLSVLSGPNVTTVTIADCCAIHQDGTVELREGLKLDDASRAFWVAISALGVRRRAEGCAVFASYNVSAGVAAMGPMDVGLGKVPIIHIAEGTELKGPLRIEVCDGRVTISKGTKP